MIIFDIEARYYGELKPVTKFIRNVNTRFALCVPQLKEIIASIHLINESIKIAE